ncbi:hypothetical protein DLJ60_26050 [Micromonospora chalcea]|uniref:Uncharacterized protein n=1 Tax=Micromonospora chalcea TaxID=1874 RepID=A0ABX9XWR0_MICCH|nr:hypothetical protein A8711_08790 [Micromonospora sp. II]RQW87529.1 hypothetical protein DLJ60_26050 [Micromonospora chalcea]RQX30536.1 hypothetical protein DLJ57_20925 [Micromonospora chalcea]
MTSMTRTKPRSSCSAISTEDARPSCSISTRLIRPSVYAYDSRPEPPRATVLAERINPSTKRYSCR